MKEYQQTPFIRGWCNGNTVDFESIAPGSTPGLRVTTI